MTRAVDEPAVIAKNQLNDARRQWQQHLKVCRQCRPLTGTRNRYCIEGWAMVTTLRQIWARYAALTAPPQDGTYTLF